MTYKLSRGEEVIGTAENIFDLYAQTQESGAWQRVNPDAMIQPMGWTVNFSGGGQYGLVPGFAIAEFQS